MREVNTKMFQGGLGHLKYTSQLVLFYLVTEI